MVRYSPEELETKLRLMAQPRVSRKKLGDKRYANDAGYWDGGRCNYGGTHNLQEDCEQLARFFTVITELKNARKELINFTNQQEFEKNKQTLLSKTTDAINGLNMKTSNNTSIGGVCIIWEDFSDKLNLIIGDFRKDLERLKTDIEQVPYNEIKELQKLLFEERSLKNEIEENERRAKNEPDENKRRQFIFLVDEAKEKWKKVLERKQELKSSRLGDDFNPDQHIENFLQAVEDKLSGKNRPLRPTSKPNQSPSNSNNFNTDNTSSFDSSPTLNNNGRSFLEKYWKELLLTSAFLGGCYYILNQKDHEETT